ncbi:MAG: efflux RND transporter periplasmic adaptor subunit [Candidatus Dadabacteria bacterium]
MIRNKRIVLAFIVILIGIAILVFSSFRKGSGEIVYKTAKVDRGDISSYVSATGTINPINAVEIGNQISGTVESVYVDFNSRVKKGDPLAQIDPAPFRAKLTQTEADLKKAQLDYELAKRIMDADEELYKKRLIPKQEYDDSKAKFSSAAATLESARAEFDTAKSNLDSTTIRSPIDGVVISKDINVGQTIALGHQSPAPFLIAEDLANMQLDAYVSEADIGKIKEGQEGSFTVDAYPNETFRGRVSQIRNSPITTQNVVTYDVVLSVDNHELKLKPGMTADVKILVAHREDVLRVPRAALRFIPPPSAKIEQKSIDLDSPSVVWIPLRGGVIRPIPIKPGISDDRFTEVLDGSLKEGEEVIIEAIGRDTSGSQPLGPLPQPQRF